MKNNNEMDKGATNQSPDKNQKSWLERHLWTIATLMALFLMRMCNELSRH